VALVVTMRNRSDGRRQRGNPFLVLQPQRLECTGHVAQPAFGLDANGSKGVLNRFCERAHGAFRNSVRTLEIIRPGS